MAVRYWVTGGDGNFNSTSNWSATSGGASGQSVPGLADDAIWDSNSGTGTVSINVLSRPRTVDFTNFAGTVDFQNSLFVGAATGSITLGASLSFANTTGTPVLGASGTPFTLRSNTKVFPYDFIFNSTAASTITLSDNFETRDLILGTGAGLLTVNNNKIFVNRNLTNQSSVRGILGTTIVEMKGSGTISSVSTGGALARNLIINTPGTISFTGTFGNSTLALGTHSWTYTAGTVLTQNSTFNVPAGSINLSGITFENIRFSMSGAGASNLLSDLVYSNNFTQTVSTTLNSSTLRHVGSTGSFILSQTLTGTSLLRLEGSGFFDAGNASFLIGLIINTNGTYSVSSRFTYLGKNFSYISGNVDFSATTLNFQGQGSGSDGILDVGSLSFGTVSFGAGGWATIGVTLSSPLNANAISLTDVTSTSPATLRLFGDYPFVCNYFYFGNFNQRIELQNGLTYSINQGFINNSATNTSIKALRSTLSLAPLLSSRTPGVKSYLKLAPGATQEITYIQFRDVDASSGQTIWVFGGSVSDCVNINTFTQPKSVGS